MSCNKGIGVLMGLFWLLSVAIWLGVYLGIWRPYFAVDWRDSECIVQNVTSFRWIVTSDDGDSEYSYSSMSVLVRMEERWVQGFACGLPDSYNSLLGSSGPTGAYPYEHSSCPVPSTCGKLEMLPPWYCSDCHTCKEKVTGQIQTCRWTLSPEAQDLDPAKWPDGYRLEVPLVGTAYVEVVLREEVYYSQGEYVFLHVFGGVGIVLLPVVGLVLWMCARH